MRGLGILAAAALLASPACSTTDSSGHGLRVVSTVSPIVDIVRHVAGGKATVEGLVPEGVDSHTFEPTPETAREIADADVMFVNGLHLEDAIVDLARASGDSPPVFSLGDHVLDESEYVYDRSFPASEGKPNPHVWMDVPLAIDFAELVRDELARVDPQNASRYERNAAAYTATLRALDAAIRAAVATIPVANRVLLTYHDSFAYFARDYGFRVIGAIQPSDFAEPSAQEVASLIDQIEREHVRAIFGSEVFPSPVLAQIARETGAKFEDSLRDDDLPGETGEPDHSYAGLMVYDVSTIVERLGGDPSALRRFDLDATSGT